MKANKVKDISAFYVGKDNNRRTQGTPKVGETAQKPQDRERQIRKKEKGFQMIACLYLFFVTKAQRRYIESYVRMKMEKYCTNIGDDHFRFTLRKEIKDIQYRAFAIIAMSYAIECCEKENIKYYFTWLK